MSRYSRHINEGEEININGETFLLKASIEKKIPVLVFDALKVMKDADTKDMKMSDLLENLSEDRIKSITELIELTLKASYPDESDEDTTGFINKYFMDLMTGVIGLYMPKADVSDDRKRAEDRLEKIKKARKPNVDKEPDTQQVQQEGHA